VPEALASGLVMSKPIKPPLVEVSWIDAKSSGDSIALKDVTPEHPTLQLLHRVSCGYLVLQTEDRVVLASDFDPNENPPEVGEFTIIPKGWVTAIKRYGGRKPKVVEVMGGGTE
jgi:hypothetical protein